MKTVEVTRVKTSAAGGKVAATMETFFNILRTKGIRGVNKGVKCSRSPTNHWLVLTDRNFKTCRESNQTSWWQDPRSEVEYGRENRGINGGWRF